MDKEKLKELTEKEQTQVSGGRNVRDDVVLRYQQVADVEEKQPKPGTEGIFEEPSGVDLVLDGHKHEECC